MNIHRERYEKWDNLISKNKRLTLKELEYYIKFNEAWDYPKKFTITELKYWILYLFNDKDNQKLTIEELKKEIQEHHSMYDIYDYVDDDYGGDVYLGDGVYLTSDGGSYDDRD